MKMIPWTSEYSFGVVKFFESEYNSIHGNIAENNVKNNDWRYKNIKVLMFYDFFPQLIA